MADPLSKDHDVKFRPLARLVWTYSKSVQLNDIGTRGTNEGLLVFGSIDTVADIIINKIHLFRSHDNQVNKSYVKS